MSRSNSIEDNIRAESESTNIYRTNQPLPSLSVFNWQLKQARPIRHWTKESLKFVSFLILKDILIQESYGEEELIELCTACRSLHRDDGVELKNIDELENNYDPYKAIQYYTRSSFLFRTVNEVCGTENIEDIYKFRIYISDLHKKLNQLDTKQTNCIKPLIHEVYRGKLITGSVLQQLIDNEGRLIYVNGFLSTTIDRDVALAFSGNQENQDQGVKSILFLLKIDENAKQTYAYIADESVMKDELEVLFSLGTIWRIESITHDKSLCIIELTLCEELEPETTQLRAKYANENVTLLSLGDILLELGNEDEAKWCYREMLDKPCNDNETVGILYYRIGMLQLEKKLYDVALETLKKAAESLEKLETKRDEITLPGPLYIYDRRSPLLTIYYNMGLMYENKRKFDKAIDCYESATKEKGSSLERATVCDTLGVLYFCRGNYFKACEYHEHACQLIDDTYPEWKDFKDHLKRARDQLQNNPKTG